MYYVREDHPAFQFYTETSELTAFVTSRTLAKEYKSIIDAVTKARELRDIGYQVRARRADWIPPLNMEVY